MKLITFSCLFVALSTGIGHSEPIFLRHPLSASNLNANARYHARRHTRHAHKLLNGVIVLLFMSLVVLALAPRLRLSDLIGRIWKRK
jgi:hypothetical protein